MLVSEIVTESCTVIPGRIVTGDSILHPGKLHLEGDRIVGVEGRAQEPGAVVDAETRWVLPGLVSLHIHGGLGYDFVDEDPRALPTIGRFLDSEGVTSYLATLISRAVESMNRRARAIESFAKADLSEIPGVVGVHFEGPFLNPEKSGLHQTADLADPTPAGLEALVGGLDPGRVRWVTMAPELPGAMETLERARELGIRVAAGHSMADFEQGRRAIAQRATHATHLFNAMVGLHHRAPGLAGAFLDDREATVEIIPDGVHVHEAILRLVIRQLGVHRVAAVTDSLAPTGLGAGLHHWGGWTFTLSDDPAARTSGGGIGSILRTQVMVRNLLGLGLDMAQVGHLVATTPARILGLADRGSLEPGHRADLVVLNSDYSVHRTWRGGRVVFEEGTG